MKKIFLILITTVISISGLNAQVGINTENPNPLTVLDVMQSKTPKGVMVPRMTEAERDLIDISNDSVANSLMIYNTVEDCYNYFSKTEKSWISVCGGMAKAVFTVDNCDEISFFGTYTKAVALDGSNYLKVNVDVTKEGSYNFSGNTTNGYGFTTQGTFLSTGMQTITIPGQGKPLNENQSPGDLVTFTSSGGTVNCSTFRIPVMPPTASFSLNCSSAKFNGAYVKNKSLTAANTVTMSVNVTDISTGGSWSVFSNTVNGISFQGSGMFTTTGQQTITLQGNGTPTTTDPITLKFTTNSKDGAATCMATVNIAIPPMTVLSLGTVSNAGYSVFSAAADTYKMLMDKTNFGTQDNSTVKFGDGTTTWKVLNPTNGVPGAAVITNYLNGTTTGNPPDIVITGIGWEVNDATMIQAFVKYLQNGGVLIMFCEQVNAMNAALLNAIFGTGTAITTPQNGNSAGTRYLFSPSLSNDPVLNGPFGNLAGLYWGEDASSTATVTGMPASTASQITVYTFATGTVSGNGNPTMFRHNSLNFIWAGDGGFNSSYDYTSTTVCPFYIQQTIPHIPLPKPVQYSGGNGTNGAGNVWNSIFTANAMSWALQTAITSGINKDKF